MYTQEQKDKNSALVDNLLAKYTPQQRGDVKREMLQVWADDDEAKAIIEANKKQFDLEASPEEVEEAFKNLRV
jgi:hypothetical protein